MVTFRGLVGAMLKELPAESRAAIGDFLVKSASGEQGDRTNRVQSDVRFYGPQRPCA